MKAKYECHMCGEIEMEELMIECDLCGKIVCETCSDGVTCDQCLDENGL